MHAPIRKAVFPVAGLGTRFLPATKAMPKEMLTVVDRPLIQYVVDEARAAGIEHCIFVTGRNKAVIEEHFDVQVELEATLRERGRTEALEELARDLPAPGQTSFTRQQVPLGLGHAVWCARDLVGNEPFAVLLGDDLLEAERPGLRQLIDNFEQWGQGVVALKEVPPGQEHLYGIIDGDKVADRDWRLRRLVEKPAPGSAPSRLAIIGRYVLPPEIFDILEQTPPGRGGEIQLTDAMAVLCERHGMHGLEVEGRRFDAGDRAGYVLAVLYYALRRKDIGADVRAGAQRLLDELGRG